MESFNAIKEVVLNSFVTFAQQGIEVFKNLIVGFILILIGWIIAKIISTIVRRGLKSVRFDDLASKINVDELLNRANISTPLSTIMGKIVYYIVFIFFLVPAFELMGLALVSEALTNFMAHLPNLFVALLTFVIGYFVADLVRKVIKTAGASFGSETGKLMGNIVFYFIIIIVIITALNQAGVNTEIINSNFSLAIGGILLAFAIAYGIASRDLLASILSSFYNRKKYTKGQHIKIGGLQGTVEEIDNVSMILRGEDRKTVIPLSRLLTENVEILD